MTEEEQSSRINRKRRAQGDYDEMGGSFTQGNNPSRKKSEYREARMNTFVEDITELFPKKESKKEQDKHKQYEGLFSYFNIFAILLAFTRPGGVKSTIFNLLNATAGAAVVAMPGAFRSSGLVFSFFQLILACLVNFVSSSCLLYTSYEWNCFSYSKIAMNCYGKAFTKFVDFIFFINVFGTTLSYAVLIQGNMVTSFSFIRLKYWKSMPAIMYDPDSVFWVVFFAVTPSNLGFTAPPGHQTSTEEPDHLQFPGIPDCRLHHGGDYSVYLRANSQPLLR